MKIKCAILFDADGTLLDTMGLHARLAVDCIMNIFEKHIDVSRAQVHEWYISTAGVPFAIQLESFFYTEQFSYLKIKDLHEQCVLQYQQRKNKEVYRNSTIFEDALFALSDLSKTTIKLYVSTSTEEALIIDALGQAGAIVHFTDIMGYEKGNKTKHIEYIAKKEVGATLFFVGDTPYDVGLCPQVVTTIGRFGNAAGAHSKRDLMNAGATYVTDDLRSLKKIIEAHINKLKPKDQSEICFCI